MTLYDTADSNQKDNYIKMLTAACSISPLFSDSKKPYLDYRIVENLYCRCFGADNLARLCIAVDAILDDVGIGVKTFVDNTSFQKIAEFDKQKNEINTGDIIEDVIRLGELRNERLDFVADTYKISNFIYHYVTRGDNTVSINECPMDYIDIDSIKVTKESTKGVDFTDSKNTYRFSRAKSVLYENFELNKSIYSFGVTYYDDPYVALMNMYESIHPESFTHDIPLEETLCLPLYSTRGDDHVPLKSGLNQWNAGGRARDYDEIYIPFNKAIRDDNLGFFPDRDKPFDLKLPNGEHLSAKVCQEQGKAIMSNPNKDLGKWLLRDVLKLKQGELVTLQMLEDKGINSVLFTKHDDSHYSIDFNYVERTEN